MSRKKMHPAELIYYVSLASQFANNLFILLAGNGATLADYCEY